MVQVKPKAAMHVCEQPPKPSLVFMMQKVIFLASFCHMMAHSAALAAVVLSVLASLQFATSLATWRPSAVSSASM